MATALSNLLALLALDESAYLKGLENSKNATDNFAGNLANVGGAVVVGAATAAATAIVGIGTAAYDAAETLDVAYDNIAVATGATGGDLDQLKSDFDAVFAAVPSDAESVSDAIGVLNSRLGISGTALQGVAVPLLNVSRLLGGDVKQYAEDFTRVMGDWNVPVEDAAGSLDSLFMASQQTGADLGTLMQQVVQYGAPMRNFGFSFTESTALLSAFAAQGVNTETVMGGMRIAQGKFITQGKDMKTGLWDTVDAIQNAATSTDALAIATEIFGAKAAGDMVDTIRSGKFDIEGLATALDNAGGAVDNVAQSTIDGVDKFQIFKNQLTLTLAPIGDKIRDAFGSVMDAMIEILNRPDVQAAILNIGEYVSRAITTIIENIPAFIAGVQNFITFLQNNQGIVVGVFAALGVAAIAWGVVTAAAAWAAISPLLPVIAVLVLIAAAAYLLYEAWVNNWGGIQEKTAAVWDFIKSAIDTGLQFMSDLTSGKLGEMSAIWANVWDSISVWFSTTVANIKSIFELFQLAFAGDWEGFGAKLREIWDRTWEAIKTVVSNAWDNIKIAFSTLVDKIIEYFKTVDWGKVGMDILTGIGKGLLGALPALISIAKGVASAVSGVFSGVSSGNSVVTASANYGRRAGGGSVYGGNPYIVGEKGPELFVPGKNGMIVPNGGGNQAADNKDMMLMEEIRRMLQELPDDIARAVRTATAKAKV